MLAAHSPMITQGAIVLPAVTRGMIDPSAMRRRSIPCALLATVVSLGQLRRCDWPLLTRVIGLS